ncbi:hypothetical protein BDN71DRAFT_1589011 [Pleurotus eryngii]|uniref:Ribonuclease H1 N-terminal domain-containing protein n=1 Tax=Pleurotus eryngii TaxID=5323 RepID=A0A9P6A138_PLEER|nr:hypothetical protein BDN71DRAFT_1589011 [Pleurotus eryngii]
MQLLGSIIPYPTINMHSPIDVNTMVEALAALGFTPQRLAAASAPGAPPTSATSVASAAAPVATPAAAPVAAPVATPAAAPAAAPVGSANGNVASTIFQCPSCLAVHSITPIPLDGESPQPDADESPELNADAATASAHVLIPVVAQTDANANAPPTPGVVRMPPIAAGADIGSLASPWYAVTTGVQVGVFSDWTNVVQPLVRGIPNWRCKRFATFELARRSFNLALTRGSVRIYADPTTLLA